MDEDIKNLLDMTVKLWNEYLQLPEEHAADRADFCNGIHQLQRILATHIARRYTPFMFPTRTPTKSE